MEPLSLKLRKGADFALLGTFIALVIIPISFSLYRNFLDFDFEFLSPLFFWILLKSILFAFLQASLSILAIASFSYFLGNYVLNNNVSTKTKLLLRVSSFLSFSLSPTLVALSLLLSFSSVFGLALSGIGAIVLCHFLMNAAYFTSYFYKRLERYYSAEGADLSAYMQSLGATRAQKRKLLAWPVFLKDLRSWGPQVFLWCFMSFAPVVLLAANTGQNTPELLLYYSLLNDPSGSRVLVIFLVTALISFFLTRYAYRKPKALIPETYSAPQQAPQKISLRVAGLCVALLFPFLYTLISPLFLGPTFSKELLASLLPTSLIFGSTFLISLFFSLLTLVASKEHKLISFCNFISAPMLLMGFLALNISSGTYYWISLGSFVALLPWAHRRLRSELESLPESHRDMALSLGMNNFTYIRYYLWPELGPSVLKLSLLFSLWSLGEYTFSKAYLESNSTLALFIDEKLRRYQFSEASTALSLSLLLSVIVVTPLLWKAKKNASLRL